MDSSKRAVLDELGQRIRRLESGRRHAGVDRPATRVAAIEALISEPEHGLPQGVLVELFSAGAGAGAWTLGIVMAVQACERKSLVIVDADRQFYFPGVVRFGLDPARCLIVRPSSRRDAYLAIVHALRSRAVGAVLGWQGRLGMRPMRRVQLSADSGGGLAILLRPASALRDPSCAAVRLLVSHDSSSAPAAIRQATGARAARFGTPSLAHLPDGNGPPHRLWRRRMRVEVLRCRGRSSGASQILEIDDETGHVHPLASVAVAAPSARSARASG